MIKLRSVFLLLFGLNLLFVGCKNDDFDDIPEYLEIHDFVWKGMNSWYNWQTDVSNLANSQDNNNATYINYLENYSTPEQLFGSLLYDSGNTDRFSWFIDDYVEQNNAFQGISKSFGFKFKAVKIGSGNVILYIKYVSPNSPASDLNIERGDIINALDGTTLTESNYYSIIGRIYDESVVLSFVDSSLNHIEDKSITAIELSVNPVHYKSVFDDGNGKKIGYLVYNGFRSSYNDELNEAFAYFESESINELILDLRYNGGGSVLTTAYLASMILGNVSDDEIFAELRFNSKQQDHNGYYKFYDELEIYNANGSVIGEESINRLYNLSRLYVLTSSNTASASEMIINGLNPFISVITVGDTTYGKNVGSITLYDSPSSDYTNIDTADSSHLNAMQPIVFQIYNKSGESDYTNGFSADIEVKEHNYWENILPFGDENEVVLNAALVDLGYTSKSGKLSPKKTKQIDLSSFENKFSEEMYIDESFFTK